MNRPFWLFFVLLFALIHGCQRAEVAPLAEPQPIGPRAQRAERPQNRDEVKTPLLRTLLGALDDAEADADQKNPVREMIYNADEQLHDVLGKNSRNVILRTNQKPLGPVIEPRHYSVGAPVEEESIPAPIQVVPTDPSTH